MATGAPSSPGTGERPPAPDLNLAARDSAVVRPTKLFIGGISRRTTTKQLREHFSKGGRVLDCVAMRQPDGRPRGFGYVTLDSPAAAEHFLREPQLIDDRYVDLKPAVPDTTSSGGGSSGSKATPTTPCKQVASVDGGDLPSAGRVPPPAHPMVAGGAVASAKATAAPGKAAPGKAADSNVPAPTRTLLPPPPGIARPWEDVYIDDFFSKMIDEEKRAQPVKVRLEGVLSVLKPEASAAPLAVPVALCSIAQKHAGDVTESPEAPPPAAPLSPLEDDGSDSWMSSGSEDGLSLPPGYWQPSAGSAKHTVGECRRCNFFAKGRCRNGVECSFCHLPHDRRKLSRQEKREAQAARLLAQQPDARQDDTPEGELSN